VEKTTFPRAGCQGALRWDEIPDSSKPFLHPLQPIARVSQPERKATSTSQYSHPYVDVNRSWGVEGSTSTTSKFPVTWPMHCENTFARASHEVYVLPKCVLDCLKRAPRMMAYRPPRDCLDTPSPCSRAKAKVSHSTTTTVTTPPPRTSCRADLFTPRGKKLRPFQLQSPPLKPPEPRSVPVELMLSMNPQPCVAAQVSITPPMPVCLKDLFEKYPPPSFKTCICNQF
jgi:hypothetical protein